MSTVGALYNCCRYLNGLDKEMLFLEEEKKLLKNVSISECWFVNWSQKTDLSHRSEANESSFEGATLTCWESAQAMKSELHLNKIKSITSSKQRPEVVVLMESCQ